MEITLKSADRLAIMSFIITCEHCFNLGGKAMYFKNTKQLLGKPGKIQEGGNIMLQVSFK